MSIRLSYNLLWGLLFFYFLTLSAELLHLPIYLFKLKLNHLIALLLFLVILSVERSLLIPVRLTKTFCLFILSIIISCFFSHHPLRSVGYLCVALFSFFCFFLLPFHLMMRLEADRLLKIYFSSFVCIGLYALCQTLLSFIGIYDPLAPQRAAQWVTRAQALCYEPSYYALYASAFVTFYNAKTLLLSSLSLKRSTLLSLLGVNLLLLCSTSTGGFFSYFLCLATLLILGRYRPVTQYFPQIGRQTARLALFLGTLFGGIALFFYEVWLDTFFKFFHRGFFTHWSFAIRWKTMQEAWEVFCAHPWFGVGPGGVGPYLLAQEGVARHEMTFEAMEWLDPQNLFTETLASVGIVGFCTLMAVMYHIARPLWITLSHPQLTLSQRATLLSLGLSVIVMVGCLQINQGLFRSYVWVHLALATGYATRLRTDLLKTPCSAEPLPHTTGT